MVGKKDQVLLDFVIVIFSGQGEREVFVDGTHAGTTNEVIALESGTHEFSLGGPMDYEPPNVLMMLSDTSILDPLVIEFRPTQSA